MSKEKKLVNKIQRRERWVREPKKDTYKVDKSQETLQSSPKAYKLMRKPQRRMDASFGYDTVGAEPHLEYKCIASAITRFDFDPGAGTDFGLRLTLPAIAGNKAEVRKVTTVADVAGSLNNKYWLLDTPDVDYYVWYNINAAGTDPLIPGRTGIAVAGATNASANTLASATSTAVGLAGGSTKFTTSVLANVVTITDKVTGAAPDAVDGAAPTGFTFQTTVQGATATKSFVEEIGVRVGDLVVVEEDGSQVENRMLEVTAIVSSTVVRLDDVSTFTGTESNASVRFIISGMPKSYT